MIMLFLLETAEVTCLSLEPNMIGQARQIRNDPCMKVVCIRHMQVTIYMVCTQI